MESINVIGFNFVKLQENMDPIILAVCLGGVLPVLIATLVAVCIIYKNCHKKRQDTIQKIAINLQNV
jgi:sorbitol-specific phosphotransferase system component IIC